MVLGRKAQDVHYVRSFDLRFTPSFSHLCNFLKHFF